MEMLEGKMDNLKAGVEERYSDIEGRLSSIESRFKNMEDMMKKLIEMLSKASPAVPKAEPKGKEILENNDEVESVLHQGPPRGAPWVGGSGYSEGMTARRGRPNPLGDYPGMGRGGMEEVMVIFLGLEEAWPSLQKRKRTYTGLFVLAYVQLRGGKSLTLLSLRLIERDERLVRLVRRSRARTPRSLHSIERVEHLVNPSRMHATKLDDRGVRPEDSATCQWNGPDTWSAKTIRAVGKKIAFLVVRQLIDTVQCVLRVTEELMSTQMVKYTTSLSRESIVDIDGEVTEKLQALYSTLKELTLVPTTGLHCRNSKEYKFPPPTVIAGILRNIGSPTSLHYWNSKEYRAKTSKSARPALLREINPEESEALRVHTSCIDL
ncbi:hypothetical protein M5K25_012017 [Dendrobium thyrsiflorum]|uniref:Uncharacterized protein n=1 Tax=Dendrobium thyrsiflorum TaxID=117978 RepID=A0ABD0V4A8_DENTH